ncbi:MAG: metal-dependent hydrolase, partial [Nitrospinota bacterium]
MIHHSEPFVKSQLAICCWLFAMGMMAPTHIVFGLLTTALLGTLLGSPIAPAAFAFAALGALLPDIDTTTSSLGRLCYPLAWYLERRFGHRGASHSLVGLLLAATLAASFVLLLSPLSRFSLSWSSWSAFVVGYLSHLLADSMNKSGVPLFWPQTTFRAVLPGNERYRIQVRSSAELAFLALLLPLTALAVPLNQVSLTTTLHYVIRDVNSAVDDYQAWAGVYQVWVEMEGRHNLSQKPVQGVFEAVGTAGVNAIVIRDAEGDIYAVGNSREDQIFPHAIRAVKGQPIRTEVREIRLSNQLLGDLFAYIIRSPTSEVRGHDESVPSTFDLGLRTSDFGPLEVWIEGWFITTSSPMLVDDAGEFNRVKASRSARGESQFTLR